MKRKLFYLSELNIPSTSAQCLQVLKMCDSFAQRNFDVELLVFSCDTNFKKLKLDYNLRNKIKIKSIFKKKKKINLFYRLYFIFYLIFNLYNKKIYIFSRSVLSSVVLALFGIKNILEIHHLNYGFTKFFFKLTNFNIVQNNLRFILINKNINKFIGINKNLVKVLPDSSNAFEFSKFKKIKKIKNSCVYTGSFYKGKGVEIILEIAKKMKNFKFFLYGDILTMNKALKSQVRKVKNIHIKNHVPYNQIPKTLNMHDIILMPYKKKVYVRHAKAEVGKFMSPLKLYDYLNSNSLIIASKHDNYKEILKHKTNSILCSSNNINEWVDSIRKYNSLNIFKRKLIKKANFFMIDKNWDTRVSKILNTFNL